IQAAFGIEPNGVRYFFSGAKGFHECIPALLMDARPAVDVPRRLKAVAFAIAGAAGVEIDRAIYDVNRLLRVPNTRHPKSNLWKAERAWEELLGLSVDEIRCLAAQPREFQRPRSNGAVNEGLAALYATAIQQDGSSSRTAGGNGPLVEVLRAAYVPGKRHALV